VLQEWDSRLFGISLHLPWALLDAQTEFTPPPASPETPTSFLWQAPNSEAVLFLGERWVELHGFVSRLLAVQDDGRAPPLSGSQKLVSKKYPSWLEYALKLCQVRGYWTLYPSQPTSASLATVHNELYQPPEEYEEDMARADMGDGVEVALVAGSLLETLPKGGSLLPFHELPLLSWDGKQTSLHDSNAAAVENAMDFRRLVGGCDTEGVREPVPEKSAADLFCSRLDG